jgi:hypothetical protein
MNQRDAGVDEFARKLAKAYSAFPQVEAVALAGSRAGPLETDVHSDVDIYVYGKGRIAIADRARIAEGNSTEVEIGNTFWDEGDEWRARAPPVNVDVIVRDVSWIEDEISKVLDRYEARLGYSTCFVHHVQSCVSLYDRGSWLAALKARADRAYAPALRDAILAKNHPVLRNAHSAYLRQIESAAARDDFVSVNHRVAALLASYFDIILAVNGLTHPGEKRMVRFVLECCASKPEGLADDVMSLVASIPVGGPGVVHRTTCLLDALDDWLRALGLLPVWPRSAGDGWPSGGDAG